MKKIIFLWIAFFPITSFAQVTGSEITFIKLTDGIGYVIDSTENDNCKCIPYLNKKEFRYAVIVQFPDSHVVLRIKRLNHDGFTDVQMTEAEVTALQNSASNINQGFSIVDSSTEKLMLHSISGDNTTYDFLNYEELKFPVNLNDQENNVSKKNRVYRQFKVGFGVGVGFPFSNDLSGLLLTFEPATRINDALAIGLRIETMAPISFEYSHDVINSFTMNLQYYFSTDKFRLLTGIGFGTFGSKNTGREIGFYPRVGFDQGHFSMSMDFNLIPNPSIKLYSYLGIRIGFFLGGGRK